MKIPSKINVFGKKYKVKIVKMLKDSEGKAVSGLHSPITSTISLDAEMKGEELDQTFLHELGHAVQDRVAVTQGHISEDLIEVIVDSMATFMSETFHLRLK